MLLQAYSYVRVMAGDVRSKIHDRVVDLVKSETGATAAEYALLVTLIAVVLIGGATLLGNNINTRLSTTGTTVGS